MNEQTVLSEEPETFRENVTFFTLLVYLVPTFSLAYLLYPFKFINKRGKFSIWLFMAIIAIFLICIGAFFVALSFSNM